MVTLITILILLASIVLAFIILVQNPKGGGLSGSFGSLGSQVMGVKQSTDVMEKSTWTVMGVVAVLCITSVIFFETPKQLQTPQQQQQPGAAPAQQAPAPAANAPQQQPAAPAGN